MYIFIKLIIFILFFYNNVVYAQEQKEIYKQTIAIDLDGVLNNYTKYDKNNIPEIKKGAKEFIEQLYKSGYILILYTNRESLLATKWLIANDLDKYFTNVTNVKPMATIYIDDRALNFNGDFKETYEQIKNFKPYWK